MTNLIDAVNDFLAQDSFAVAGVSRSTQEAANAIFKKLKSSGKQVFPINPAAGEVEGEQCYASIAELPQKIDGIVISTPISAVMDIVKDCLENGVTRVWMHRSFGEGSVNQEAVAVCKENGITVIPGGCPMMFCEPVDFGHKCIKWIMKMSGGLPQKV